MLLFLEIVKLIYEKWFFSNETEVANLMKKLLFLNSDLNF